MRAGAILVLSGLLLGAAHGPSSAASSLVVEESSLNVTIRGRDRALAALIVKPSGATDRLPIALIAHGSPRDSAQRPTYRVAAMLPRARSGPPGLAGRGVPATGFLTRADQLIE